MWIQLIWKSSALSLGAASCTFFVLGCFRKAGKIRQFPPSTSYIPLFVYFCLFFTLLSLFYAGFMACLYPLQKCHILGCWNFNVSAGYFFNIFLQYSWFSSGIPRIHETPLLQRHSSCKCYFSPEEACRVNAISAPAVCHNWSWPPAQKQRAEALCQNSIIQGYLFS